MTRPSRALLAALYALCGLCAAPTASAQNAALGRDLAATCANCHGTNGNARAGMRSLAGAPPDRIVAAMADFKNGNQPSTIMQQIAKGYSDAQVQLIADFFAAQKPTGK